MRLGIDFGTCFSSAAFMDGGTLTFVKDPLSVSFSVPSSAFVTPQGQVLIGKAANNQHLRDPQRYRREFKRDLGKTDPLHLGTHPFLPEQLIAHVLGKIKSDADAQMKSLGKPLFTGAVLTIPATYQEHKRNLMLKAATKAGFGAEELTLLEEPVAAALHYARQSNMAEGEILLVYDLGGGTFDTALLQKRGDRFEYLALPAGIERCGGIDFDRAIYTDLIKHHPELQDVLRGDRQDKAALMARASIGERCIDLKHQLSDVEEAELSVIVPGTGNFIEYSLTRTAFQQMIAPTIQETISCSQQMLQQANISPKQINRILLVGGSCRIPYVQHILQQTFKRPINAASDLELVVCQGAALYATQHEICIVSATPGEAEYTSIGAALKQPKLPRRIVVRPGIYQESLVLDREVEIIGARGEIIGIGAREEIIITSPAAIGIKMATSAALVRGITLQHNGPQSSIFVRSFSPFTSS